LSRSHHEEAYVQVLISGWSGSTNLGDELVLAGLLELLGGHRVAAVSVDPVATRRRFDIGAIAPREVARMVGAVREADLLVFGGGGLLQDETSPFNLPYHLARPLLAAAAGTPLVGVGLGAGPLERPGSRQLVRTGLARAVSVTVRDEASRSLLASCGVSSQTGADLALALPGPRVEVEDVITVSLRPWSGGGGWLPVGAQRRHDLDAGLTAALADGLDELAERTGLRVRFVALQADRDDEVHARVAALMRTPTERRCPEVHEVVGEVAAGRLVVAMRYHAGISAVLGGRPAVLLGYSPKVEALADELGTGARLLPVQASAIAGLAEAGEAVIDQGAAVDDARERLQARLEVDRAAIAAGLRAAHGAS
jgi:polysaccharide pyruvyl transferase CsaB